MEISDRANAAKSYAHFDRRVTYREVQDYVEDPKFVAAHAFYPLISNTIRFRRYQRNETAENGRKKKTKERPIAYASHLDHRIYQYYAYLWGSLYEKKAREFGIDDAVVAYRQGMHFSNITGAKKIIDSIRSLDECIVLIADFSKFFENLEHKYLVKMMRTLFEAGKLRDDHYNVLKNVLHYSCWPIDDLLKRNGFGPSSPTESARLSSIHKLNKKRRVLSDREFKKNKAACIRMPWKEASGENRGIPQGLAVSGILSNIYMLDVDGKIVELLSGSEGSYVRYCDDLAIVVPVSNKALISSALDILRGVPCVSLQPDKTKMYAVSRSGVTPISVTEFEDGKNIPIGGRRHITFLGFEFDGRAVRLKQATVSRFFNRFYRSAKHMAKAKAAPSKKRVSALYGHYTPKGAFVRRGSGGIMSYGNFFSYVYRAQKAFPNDPIDVHASRMYRKINRLVVRKYNAGRRAANKL